MTREMPNPFTPARTAIAAVLALSSIPLSAVPAGAQVADPAAPPVLHTGPAVSTPPISAPVAVPSTAAPAPASTPAPSGPTDNPTIKFTPSQSVVQSIAEPAPAPAEPVAATKASVAHAEERAEKRAASVPANRAAPAEKVAREAPAAKPAETIGAPAAAVPASDPGIEAGTASGPAASLSTSEEALPPEAGAESVGAINSPADGATDSATDSNANLWLGGGAALLLLGGGAAFFLGRRRKEEEDEPFAGDGVIAEEREEAHIIPTPVNAGASLAPAAQPVMAESTPEPVPQRTAASVAAPVAQENVEAMVADRPSGENPFLTRKNRLRRANFLMTQSYPATARLDDRPPLRVRPSGEGDEDRGVQLSYSFGRRDRPSSRLKPQHGRS